MHTFYVLGGIGLVAIFFLTYFLIAATVGFGKGHDAAWDDYGEAPRKGWIRQPFSFWSDVGFIVGGLVILFWIDMSPPGSGVMGTATVYSVLLGYLAVWLGPGSMLEHGTLKESWGWADATSIHWFASFVIAYVVARWVEPLPAAALNAGPIAVTLLLWAATCVLFGLLTWFVNDARAPVTIVLISSMGLALVVDATGVFGLPYQRQWFWLVGAAVFALLGFIALFGGRRGWFLTPGRDSTLRTFQAHGLWHILMAAVVFLVYVYLRSEQAV